MGILKTSHRDTPKKRRYALAKGLEEVDREKAQEHQGGGQDPDPKELRGQRHSLGVINKELGKLQGEKLIEQDADPGDHQPEPAGERMMSSIRFWFPAA